MTHERTASPFPTREQHPTGLHQRYRVEKLYGESDPRAAYFVLRLDSHGDDRKWIDACRQAAKALIWSLRLENHLPEVVDDLERYLSQFNSEYPTLLECKGILKEPPAESPDEKQAEAKAQLAMRSAIEHANKARQKARDDAKREGMDETAESDALRQENERLKAELATEKADHSDFLAFMTTELSKWPCCHEDGGHHATPPMMWPELITCIVKNAIENGKVK